MKGIIALLLLTITGCTTSSFKTYDMGDLKVHVGSQRAVTREYSKLVNSGYTNPRKVDESTVVGFCKLNSNEIYTIRDFDVLLHELWHAQGHKEEPNF
jgi:hypothetical protein